MLKFFAFLFICVVLFAGVFIYQNESTSTSFFSTEDIAQIKANSSEFHDKKVTLKGTVSSRFGLFGKGVYNLDDDSGSIIVITSKTIPESGKKVVVNGTVNQAFSFGESQMLVIIED